MAVEAKVVVTDYVWESLDVERKILEGRATSPLPAVPRFHPKSDLSLSSCSSHKSVFHLSLQQINEKDTCNHDSDPSLKKMSTDHVDQVSQNLDRDNSHG